MMAQFNKLSNRDRTATRAFTSRGRQILQLAKDASVIEVKQTAVTTTPDRNAAVSSNRPILVNDKVEAKRSKGKVKDSAKNKVRRWLFGSPSRGVLNN